jgi:hypothetical protein
MLFLWREIHILQMICKCSNLCTDKDMVRELSMYVSSLIAVDF